MWSLESVSERSWPCGHKDRCRKRSYPSIPSWTWRKNPSPVTKSLDCEPSEVGFQVHCYVKKALCRRREWNPDTEKSRDKDGEKEFWWHSKPQLWVPASLMEARLKSAFVIGPLGESYHAVFTHRAILLPDTTMVTRIWEPTIGPLGLLWSRSQLWACKLSPQYNLSTSKHILFLICEVLLLMQILYVVIMWTS